MTIAETVRRRPGRPRDEDLDAQILDATLQLIDDGEPVTLGRVVERSGVSRAALYRRWPSLTTLVAAALDIGRTIPPELPDDGDLRAAILASLTGGHSVTLAGYPEERFRQRIRLAMTDRTLQKAYWDSHVSRRRAGVERALQRAIHRGELRADLDPAICFDLLAGVFYYQLVVRGDRLTDPAVMQRCAEAFDIAWRGMVAQDGTAT
ncbi:TetR/AcrR family transcriptional regulator [Microbacterium sp. ET2]|uniref:TetR/AcrR family transcriptional regulator n=1 Tax=Microbacterium albipurpureum TaxID=3050384 RepID=UPI00259CE363|nr:TetR/AcrR family transcriptional regulator [Microbacterium sp. ET2 (Ac-2212)]WJL94915.1 TetR/AcrR family transcriptional regulator [Microbacterium sp. ET2 (Ac-2212)]